MKRATILVGLSLVSLAAARLSHATCTAGSGPTFFSVDSTQWWTAGTFTSADGVTCFVVGSDPLKFTATASPEIGIRYAWDFGDGSPAAAGLTVYHSFSFSVDPVVVTLTVSDFSGDRMATLMLHVSCPEGPPPSGATIRVDSGAVQARYIRYSPYFALPGVPVTFSAYGYEPFSSFQWQFDHEDPEEITASRSVTHSFSEIGWHMVRVFAIPQSVCSWQERGDLWVYVRGYLPDAPDALVILGAGRVGAWSTDITLANPTAVEQFGTVATVPTPDHIDDCPGACLFFPYHLPPNGTATVHLGPGTGAPAFVGAWYVVPDETGTLPVVAARAIRQGSGIEAALPVQHLSALLDGFMAPSDTWPWVAAIPAILPGARRSDSEHSDLLLSVLQPPGTLDLSGVDVRVDLFDAAGGIVGTRDFHLGFAESRVIHDVVGALGVPSLALGQIRVTQTGGTNAFRAVLATTLAGGAVTIASGDSPAPPDTNAWGHSLPWSEVVTGASVSAAWDTELVLGAPDSLADLPSNPGSDLRLTQYAVPRAESCMRHLSPAGSAAVTVSSLSACFSGGPANLYVSGGIPRISARIFDREDPSRSADLPIPLSWPHSVAQLVFPFESESAARQNLYLTEVAQVRSVQLRVEVWSASGSLLSTRNVSLASGENRLLGDLLGTLDPSVHAGQIRVTNTGGDGVFWGLLATLGSDGSFTITPGVNP